MQSEPTRITWQSIPVSTWSDALDRLRIRGVVSGLRHVAGGSAFAGAAVTVREEVASLGGHPPQSFDVQAILQVIRERSVLVIDAGGSEVSSFGGLAARAAARRGVAGVLVDAACRDLDEIDAVGVHVWSRHVTPVSGKGRLRVASVNDAVACGGVRVCPGDFVVADRTGIAIIPADRFNEVEPIARDIDARDRAFARAIDEGKEFGSIAALLDHL
jgi:regulator of RNase E activity RraA